MPRSVKNPDGDRSIVEDPDPACERITRLVAALDGHQFDDGLAHWTAQVLGVYSDPANASDLWVQVARGDDLTDTVVLHLSRWASPQHALAALESLPAASNVYPHVIPVMQPADGRTR